MFLSRRRVTVELTLLRQQFEGDKGIHRRVEVASSAWIRSATSREVLAFQRRREDSRRSAVKRIFVSQ